MSHRTEFLQHEDTTGQGDEPLDAGESSESAERPVGLLGQLKRHARTWSRKYVEMRVAARTD